MDQWIFSTDVIGRFQWMLVGTGGECLDRSAASFSTAIACVRDAVDHGLHVEAATTVARLPGVIATSIGGRPARAG